MAEVRSLRGTTIAEIFNDGLERLDQMEAVAVSVLWKDGTVTAGHSSTEMANLALMVLALDAYQRRVLVASD